ncbi:DUF1304 domain-containing protein [Nocardia sp. BMG111209]|uniref:DUF1304 domain-containing protein n=1 Tax=Nocardia sp. BMG111209 TaxID=1160137 RepID=UPI000381DF88|nr:DUF1304 domain-containing protein [Nocardia sp. BMG111209]
MTVVANALVVIVALIHCYILVLEMFLWRGPRARDIFGTTAEFAAETGALAANQGLYNGFLAAGLFWGLAAGHAGFQFKVFFLLCVIVAGVYGTVNGASRAWFAQSLPAAVALLAVVIAG